MIINLLPHQVNIYDENNNLVKSYPPTTPSAPRVKSEIQIIGYVDDVPITIVKYGKVENLPPPVDGCYYIVNSRIQNACPDRSDLLSPDTNPQNVVRDDLGQIMGVKALIANIK